MIPLLLAGTVSASAGNDEKQTRRAGPAIGKRMPPLPKVESVTNLHTNKKDGRICYSCFKRAA